MVTPRLSVIMVNYNTLDLAVESLRSVRSRVAADTVEVIVVDNASAGFDRGRILDAWPGAQVVESPDNLGFGQGNNLGARLAHGDYLWLLNTDTLCPDDNGLGMMLGYLDAHADCAAVSPRLTDADGVVQPWQTAHFPAVWRMVLSPAARLVARLAPALGQRLGWIDTNLAPPVAGDVDQVVAAAMLVRRAAFEQVGGFSPEYFFFLEDTDLCRKLRAAGWRIAWLPDAHMVHLWGRSVRDPVARQRMFFAGQDIYLRRWHGRATLSVVRVLRLPLHLSTRRRRKQLRR